MESVKIISSKNPYILDYIADQHENVPALTRKNADFIEAVVRLDSNYANDLAITKPDHGFDPEEHAGNSNGMYCGSTAYWFDQMQNNSDFRRNVLGAVIAIDRTNSTHLEACANGRIEMRNIICGCCNNYRDLIDKLNDRFSSDNHNHMIALLTQPIQSKGKEGKRYNLSFATKFCSYASTFLNASRHYSKYDNVVSAALPMYGRIYLGMNIPKGAFKIIPHPKEDKFEHRLKVYEKYAGCIEKIIAKLQSDNINISKDELDHIIWYGYKG